MKAILKNIKNIIFDLGGVILNLDFEASKKAFSALGFNEKVWDGGLGFSDPVFYEFQAGAISPETFREKVRHILNNPDISDSQFDEAWCAMLKDIPVERIKKIQELRKNYKVYLFSNTNKIHVDQLHRDFLGDFGFAFPSVFDSVFYSQEIHDAKPAVSSFEKVIQLSGVDPAETLFVDDIYENIEGAAKAGLKTFWLKEGLKITEVF